jgi:hypothetical protein
VGGRQPFLNRNVIEMPFERIESITGRKVSNV